MSPDASTHPDAQTHPDVVALDHDVLGPPGAPVVVLIAGLGAQRHWWPAPIVADLADDHRVLLPDNRDIGRSPWLDHLGLAGARIERMSRGEQVAPPYTLRDMAADVVALLDLHHVERAHVVGASMGGMIAQHVAFGWPDRTRTLTSMLSTTGAHDLPSGDPDVLASLVAPVPTHDEDAYVAASVAGSRASANSPLFDEADAVRKHRLSFRSGLNPAGGGRQLLAVAADGDRTQRLGGVRAPALVVGGAVDPMIRVEGSRATAAAVPDAQLLELADVGHELPTAVHDEVLTALRAHFARG